MPLAPGRGAHPLLSGVYDQCTQDDSAWSVGDWGEKSYLDLNGAPHSSIPQYDASDNYRVKLLVARGMEWSPSCSDTVPGMISMKDYLQETFRQTNVLVIVYSLSFGLAILTAIGQLLSLICRAKTYFLIFFIVRQFWCVMGLVPIAVVFARTKSTTNYFERLVALSCTTDILASNFIGFRDSVQNTLGYSAGVMLGLILGSFGIEIFAGLTVIFCCKPGEV